MDFSLEIAGVLFSVLTVGTSESVVLFFYGDLRRVFKENLALANSDDEFF